jgi:hypothetical protein
MLKNRAVIEIQSLNGNERKQSDVKNTLSRERIS